MFSQACVIHSVYEGEGECDRGWVCVTRGVTRDVCPGGLTGVFVLLRECDQGMYQGVYYVTYPIMHLMLNSRVPSVCILLECFLVDKGIDVTSSTHQNIVV